MFRRSMLDYNIPGLLLRIEHDALRSGLVVLVRSFNSICSYRLLANGLRVGDFITHYIP